jgi:hypothetical protein
MRVKVRVRPPAPVVWLLWIGLGALLLMQLADPLIYALGVDTSASVLEVKSATFCIGDTRYRNCYDVRYAFQPRPGAKAVEASTVISTSQSSLTRPAIGRMVAVRFLPFLPQVATLRDYAVDFQRLMAIAVLSWMVIGIPALRIMRGRARQARLAQQQYEQPYQEPYEQKRPFLD